MALYYVVLDGVAPGVYHKLTDAKKNGTPESPGFKTQEEAEEYFKKLSAAPLPKKKQAVKGVSSALNASGVESVCDKLDTLTEAIGALLRAEKAPAPASKPLEAPSTVQCESAVAYVDGSYNIQTQKCGYGCVFYAGETKFVFMGANTVGHQLCNIAGELDGAKAAVTQALQLGVKELTIYYDYAGIESWAMHKMRFSSPYVAEYIDFMDKASETLSIMFVKVKGHSGNPGNEEADKLAKNAVANI